MRAFPVSRGPVFCQRRDEASRLDRVGRPRDAGLRKACGQLALKAAGRWKASVRPLWMVFYEFSSQKKRGVKHAVSNDWALLDALNVLWPERGSSKDCGTKLLRDIRLVLHRHLETRGP